MRIAHRPSPFGTKIMVKLYKIPTIFEERWQIPWPKSVNKLVLYAGGNFPKYHFPETIFTSPITLDFITVITLKIMQHRYRTIKREPGPGINPDVFRIFTAALIFSAKKTGFEPVPWSPVKDSEPGTWIETRDRTGAGFEPGDRG